MTRALQAFVATARDFARGINAGHAIRHGVTVRDRPAPVPAGGPSLHWVPDGADGLRLAGEFLPPPDPIDTDRGR